MKGIVTAGYTVQDQTIGQVANKSLIVLTSFALLARIAGSRRLKKTKCEGGISIRNQILWQRPDRTRHEPMLALYRKYFSAYIRRVQ